MNVCNLQAKCVKRQSLWCLISGCVCLCVCVRVCSVHRKMRCPGDEKGGPLNSQNDLNLNLQPLRGIDRILSYFDTTDLWCAICIVHFMVFLFQEVTFLFFLFFFRSKVLFSFVECIQGRRGVAGSFKFAERKRFYGLLGSISLYISKNVAEIKQFALLGAECFVCICVLGGRGGEKYCEKSHLTLSDVRVIVLCIQKSYGNSQTSQSAPQWKESKGSDHHSGCY